MTDTKDLLEDFDPDAPVRIKRVWPVVVFGFLVLGVLAASIWMLTQVQTKPTSFLVAIEVEDEKGEFHHWWSGDEAAMAVNEAFAEELETLGLDDVGRGSKIESALKGAKSIEEIRSVAADIEAGLVVMGKVRVRREVPLDGEIRDYSLALELGFFDVEDGELEQLEDELVFFEWGADVGDALKASAERMASASVAPLAASLVQTPRLERLTANSESLSSEEARSASKLKALFRIAGFYETQTEQRLVDEREAQHKYTALENSERPRVLLGDFLAQERFVGQGPGEDLILQSEPHYFEVRPDEGHYGVRRESESLIISGSEGEKRELLFEHFNFYSSQSVSKDGRRLAAILDNRGRSKWLVCLSVPEGVVKTLRVSSQEYFSTPVMSPDGKQLVYWYSPFRRAASSLETIKSQGGESRELLAQGPSMSLPRWHPDSERVFLAIGEGGLEDLVEIEVATGELKCHLGPCAREQVQVEEMESKSDLLVEGDPFEIGAIDIPSDPRYDSWFKGVEIDPVSGAFAIVEEYSPSEGSYYVGRYDFGSQDYERLLSMKVDWMELSPEGDLLAIITAEHGFANDPGRGDLDIIIVPIEGGEPYPVTLNEVDDYFQGWSRDGRYVYAAQSSKDPASLRYSSRVYRIEVK